VTEAHGVSSLPKALRNGAQPGLEPVLIVSSPNLNRYVTELPLYMPLFFSLTSTEAKQCCVIYIVGLYVVELLKYHESSGMNALLCKSRVICLHC